MAQDNYDRLDLSALTNLLLNPDNKPDVHRGALSALSRQEPLIRTSRLITVLQNVVRYPGRYDQEVMEALIDILATDPDADATVAMIENLPGVLEAGLNGTLTPEFREYYYAALLTRQRDDDLAVWAEMLPAIKSPALLAMVLDPKATSLVEAIAPGELMGRLPEPERTQILFNTITAVIGRRSSGDHLTIAVRHLRESHDPKAYEKGLDQLIDLWGQYRKEPERKKSVAILQKMLKVLDTAPRTAAERLMGKRPWA